MGGFVDMIQFSKKLQPASHFLDPFLFCGSQGVVVYLHHSKIRGTHFTGFTIKYHQTYINLSQIHFNLFTKINQPSTLVKKHDHIIAIFVFVLLLTSKNTEYRLCYWSCSAENTPTETGITGHSRLWGHLRLSGTILTWWLLNVSFISIPKPRPLHQQLLFTPSTSQEWKQKMDFLNFEWLKSTRKPERKVSCVWTEPCIEEGLKFTWQLRKNAFSLLIHPLNQFSPPLFNSAWAIKSPSWPFDPEPQP